MANKKPTKLRFKKIPAEIRQLYQKQTGKENRKTMKRFIKSKFTEILAFSDALTVATTAPGHATTEIMVLESVPHARPSVQLIKELQNNYTSRPTIIDEPGDE